MQAHRITKRGKYEEKMVVLCVDFDDGSMLAIHASCVQEK
jgi:hypothetical protein